ncbi:unnamed protein product [Malus baccata var. baccata]
MIKCDDCLGGFNLKCLKPPLKDIPEGDWICGFCEARKLGKAVQLPTPPEGKKLVRTLREKLISSDLWATHIESIWKEVDGRYWCRVHWYIIPKETAAGRQPHNLWREIYRTNDFADIEDDDEAGSDEDWKVGKDLDFDSEEDMDYDEESIKSILAKPFRAHELAANSQNGWFFGIQKIGMKKIPKHVICHKQTDLEIAKAALLLSSLPKSLLCRDKEMLEITAFIKDSISDDKCLGRCLYIHGVPGTGKTMSVLAVMKNLRSEVDARSIRPYCYVEINGLKLVSSENIYRVIYEALSGHRVGWKKAFHLLNEQFSEGKKIGDARRALEICRRAAEITDYRLKKLTSTPNDASEGKTLVGMAEVEAAIQEMFQAPHIQILGPLFKDAVPPAITKLFNDHCLTPLLQGFEWSKWDSAKPQGSWPSTIATWAAWVVQMEKIFGKQCKALGIYDAIRPSSMELVVDNELLMAASSLWCSATKTMVLPLGPIGPTILDITMILGTSPFGIPVDATISGYPSNIDLKALFNYWAIETLREEGQEPSKEEVHKLYKNFLNYNTLYLHFAGQGERIYGRGNKKPSFSTAWSADDDADLCQSWGSFVLTRDLPLGCDAHRASWELALIVSCLCTSNGEAFSGHDTLVKIGCKLGECRIILCESGAKHRLQKLQLNFPSDDVAFALKDNKEPPWLAKYLWFQIQSFSE